MNYLTKHLVEAIEINKDRLPKYAKLTGGKSKKISRMLIWSERFCLLSSWLLDWIASYWQKRGVPVFVHEFIPMDETPEFEGKTENFKPIDKLPELDLKTDIKQWKKSFKAKNYNQLSQQMSHTLSKFDQLQHFYAMTKHVIESQLRAVNLIEKHIKKAKELGVASPELFCRYVIFSHFSLYAGCILMDKIAFKIQNEGITIISKDVPHIPAHVDQYNI